MPWPFSPKSGAVLSGDMAESSASPHTRFAFRLFRELTREDETANVFFSPSSVMLCLALVHELATGETRHSMAKALEIADLDHVGIETELTTMKSAFSARPDAEVSFANALFLGRRAELASALQQQLRAQYDAELNTLDFSSPNAIATINAWVNTKTKGKIPQIVRQLSPLSALVALNAVYFKCRWLDPFRKELTRERPFHAGSGTIKQVPMMQQGGRYKYYEDSNVQVATLPYRGNMSMCIGLPSENGDAKRFRHNLNSRLWESWVAKSKSMPGTIQLPRFRVDFDAELNRALMAMGMERAFDQDRAEFEHVKTDLPPVWLDRVVHRAVAEVNEEGTEAAAATIAHMTLGAVMHQKPPKQFHMVVDHPFAALILDESTKAILFMGWIGDPQ